ncbi:MAG: hypothetical protein AB7I13_00320 [Vicinamibacterales bacterium]
MPALGLMGIAQQGGDEDFSGKEPAPVVSARASSARAWAALGFAVVVTLFALGLRS